MGGLTCYFSQKDLVKEEEDDGRSLSKGKHSRELSNAYAAENICRKHLDPRLMTKDTPSPQGSMEISQLACQCLDRRRKKRPRMTEVGESIQMLVCLLYYGFSSVFLKIIIS